MVGFNIKGMKNFKDEPWSSYGSAYEHLVIDVEDTDDTDLLIELPRAVGFVRDGLDASKNKAQPSGNEKDSSTAEDKLGFGVHGLSLEPARRGGVFVHCAVGKSRSVSVVIAYLLYRYPALFDPAHAADVPSTAQSRRESASQAVKAALSHVQRTRPMADPNDGFIRQLELWWEMGCPVDKNIEEEPVYQRWAYKREVEADLAVGQAPSRLRFEDEANTGDSPDTPGGRSLRCKKCRRTLVTSRYIADHTPSSGGGSTCQHFFIEPLSWMRGELEKGELSGRLTCPNERCGAGVGRYDWKGFKCSCDGWVTPAFSLQKARVDDVATAPLDPRLAASDQQRSMGIRFPPGARGAGGNL